MLIHGREENRSGQVVIVFAGALVVLCAIAALTCDVGNLVGSQQRMQNAADSAALGALLELWEQRAAGNGEGTAHQEATHQAERLVQSNYSECATNVTLGHWVDGAFVEYDKDGAVAVVPNAVKVRASRGESAPGGQLSTFFAGLFDVNRVSQRAEAIARYQHLGLAPLSVYEPDVPGKGGSFTLYNDTETAPGNCGILDFNGGENSLDEARDWLYYGYFGHFAIDPQTGYITLSGSTGLKSALKKPINYHIQEGDTVVACVYRSISGQGDGVTYEIVGFVAAVIDNITLDKKGDEIISVSAHTVSSYEPGTGNTEGSMRNFMKLQLME